jgi:hypothetical protein
MKSLFRHIIGFIIGSPFVGLIYVSACVVGKQRAIRFWGPAMTAYAKFFVKLTLPRIRDASEFDRFAARLKTNFHHWWCFIYDYAIAYEDRDTLALRFANCPFCEVLNQVGLAELRPYVCQGDWAAAHDNTEKWTFERQHQIGTDDAYCDHTYKRKQEKGVT